MTPEAISSAFFLCLMMWLDCRQLRAAVDALNLAGVGDREGFHPKSPFAVDGDEVGKVVLALSILGADRPDSIEKSVQREGVDAGVDFADVPLDRDGITLLDDTCNLARRIGRCGRSRADRPRLPSGR